MTRIISPSMLSADFGHLDRDTRMVDESAAGWVHVDVMDGVFVPNISFGLPVLRAIRRATSKPLDVHLMIVHPERYIERFAEAGASLITVHCEAMGRLRNGWRERERAMSRMDECLALLRSCGVKAGVSIKPATPVSVLQPWLDRLDLVLVMSVEPGFGGQSFIPGSLDKVRELRAMIDRRGLATLIEIDGGISAANAREVWSAGVDVIVAGNAIFGAADPKAEIEKILNA